MCHVDEARAHRHADGPDWPGFLPFARYSPHMAKKITGYQDILAVRKKPLILLDGSSVEFPAHWSAESRYQWRLHRDLLPPKSAKPVKRVK
jgi:hypothetical protein